ncbi:hypothetical protein QNI16_35900 [Cytophagaceae bacterium YF14B1]|uniref:Uncharacterized protein n=1 Tax=Xanthocytophaga flava TaxID=3048013 RepID=A0AAE3QZ61_9BACT|nr:hypothetical protein [Xanthocytophaga flavus]MDJ1485921.1 hypothetical protein [Xanthocytophaga flavus]
MYSLVNKLIGCLSTESAKSFFSNHNQNLTQNSLMTCKAHKQIMPFSNRYLWTLMLLFFICTVQAQQTVGGLTQIVEQIKLIANVLFIGAIVWAAIRTVIAFASGSPNAMSNVFQTILIAVFWFGFNYFVSDVASSLGGSGAGDYSGR